MHKIEDVKTLLKKHKYLPIARKAGDGVVLTMPHPRLIVPAVGRECEAYVIRRGCESGVYLSTATDPKERFTSLPEYAIRIYIMGRIFAACERVPISCQLASFEDEDGREASRIEDIIAPPADADEATREGFLTTIMTEGNKDGFPSEFDNVARSHGVYEGYRIVRGFFGVGER